ncbi:GNAT family N-acetyltransferase [uncultured Aquimarina sp.]|uniref:GNAT family N-acetyltransferase n=1 Tax=uncultured Aquimarina sp. TaxID=575652 RepID=UPI00262ABCE2|nr:GNAT family N-acetyltransferase [uncultured Aquimarina sp.]
MMNSQYIVRDANPDEFTKIGELMVKVYSQLDGFPNQEEQPNYYKTLANIGSLTEKPNTRLLIAISEGGEIGGGVVYFSDMQYYGSGGTAPQEKNAAGFRLLAVAPAARGKGIGRLLTKTCIEFAKNEKQNQVIIHSTKAMQIAWKMYEKLGFKRSEDLDFKQAELSVYGFRLML